MTLTSVFRFIPLLSVAPSAMASLHGIRARVPGGGKEGGGKNQGKTVIVELKKDKEHGTTTLAGNCDEVAKVVGGEVVSVYDQVLHGCAIRLSSQQTASVAVTTMAEDPRVMIAEEDQKVYTSQSTPYSWGLDRVDQCHLPLDGPDSTNTKVDATGIRVFVVDTGIDKEHAEFNGMITPTDPCHVDVIGEEDPFADRNGHGTHVAGTACGVNYGIARGCDLCAIRVLGDDGSGTWADVISGINHVVTICQDSSKKCVANLSLGGGYSSAVNTAVKDATDAGVVMVVAAGNDNADACTKSPASEPSAITVGSTTSSDMHSSFSNYGACVDVYAPGSDITSAWIGSPTATSTISGTSMASPHVVGIAAGILREDANADIDARLKADAKLLSAKAQQGNNMLLANTVGGCNPPTPAPTPCTQSVVKVNIMTDNYASETSWDLHRNCDESGNTPAQSGGGYASPNTLYEKEHCLPAGQYTFTIRDSYSDGLCCSYGIGYYELFVDGRLQFSGAEFGSVEEETFGSCGPDSTPPSVAPTNPPIAPTQPPFTPPPTSEPTSNPPSVAPTDPPIAPTQPPFTPPPTSEPTSKPTSSPAVCADKEEKVEFLKGRKVVKRRCSWVGRKRDRRCNKTCDGQPCTEVCEKSCDKC